MMYTARKNRTRKRKDRFSNSCRLDPFIYQQTWKLKMIANDILKPCLGSSLRMQHGLKKAQWVKKILVDRSTLCSQTGSIIFQHQHRWSQILISDFFCMGVGWRSIEMYWNTIANINVTSRLDYRCSRIPQFKWFQSPKQLINPQKNVGGNET